MKSNDQNGFRNLDSLNLNSLKTMQADKAGNIGQKIENPTQARDPKDNEAEAARRQMILSHFLSAESRSRLSTLRLVKPEKADRVESIIMRMGRPVSDPELVDLLNMMSDGGNLKSGRNMAAEDVGGSSSKPSLVIHRRKDPFEEDDDEDYGF